MSDHARARKLALIGRSAGQKRGRRLGLVVGLVIVLVAIGWWLGAVQAVLRAGLNSPGLTVGLLGLALLALGVAAQDARTSRLGVIGMAVGVLIGVVYLMRIVSWAESFDRQLGAGVEVPDSTFLPRRVLPEFVADGFARRSLTDSRYVLGSLNATMTDGGRLVWQAPLTPNSVGTYWTSGITTVVEIDADTTKPAVQHSEINLPRGGEGNFASFARLIARSIAPLSTVQEPVYDTEARAALVPLVRWVWGMPTYHAVVRFDSLGQTSVLTPGEAVEAHPHLRLYPEALVEWRASMWGAWRRGLFGTFTKRGIYEIADIGTEPAISLLDDEARGSWVVAMEPSGASFGLAGLLFMDARSGDVQWWNTEGQSVSGPTKALQIATDDPRIALLKNAFPAEPKLGILHGRVHYLVPVIPTSGSQVQKLVVVEAISGEAIVGDTYRQVWGAAQRAGTSDLERAGDATDEPGTPAGGTGSVAARLDRMAETVRLLQAQIDSLRAHVPDTAPSPNRPLMER